MKSKIKQTNSLNSKVLFRLRNLHAALVAILIIGLGLSLFTIHDWQASASKQESPIITKQNNAMVLDNKDASNSKKDSVYERVCETRTPIPGSIDRPVPACSDTRFLTETNTSPPVLTYEIKIDRFIGVKEKLIAKSENFTNGLIGKYAKLRFAGKFSGFYMNGRAKLLFNDREVKDIIGPTNIFYPYEAYIPIDYVEFPTAPGEIATNRIEFQLDSMTSGVLQVDWATLDIEVARPALLIHGARIKDPTRPVNEIWGLWRMKLKEIGLPHETIDLSSNVRKIEANASGIKTKVDELRELWKVDKINLIGYSKGGLDARHFAELEGERDPVTGGAVSQIFQIGTPNAGSPLVYILLGMAGSTETELAINDLLLQQNPGSLELSTDYMNDYNKSSRLNSKVRYTALAGVYTPNCFWCFDYFQNWAVGEGDLVVPKASVYSLPINNMEPFTSQGENKEATHEMLIDSIRIFDLFKPEIGKLGSPSQNLQSPQPAESEPATTPKAISKTTLGNISQGQQNVFNIPVDITSNVSFVMLYPADKMNQTSPTNNLDMTLVSPTGERFSTQRDDREIIGGKMEIFSFNTIPTGSWRIEVTAPTVVRPSGIVPYGIVYIGNSPNITFKGSFESQSVRSGMPLKLLGTLRNQQSNTPITGAAVSAIVQVPTTPNPTTQTVTLFDNGTNGDITPNDGIYSFNLTNTNTVGNYSIQFSASKEAGGSIPAFSRQEKQSATVTLSGSTIAGTFSDSGTPALTEGDSSIIAPPYSKLVIQAGLNITNAGNYIVLGEITDSAGNKINSSKQATLTAGAQNVPLEFDGQQIYQNRVNGSFQLTSIKLLEENGNGRLLVNSRTNAYQTAPYQFLDFQTRLFSVARTGTAVGIDNNGNGLFDLLRATIHLDVRQAGSYVWAAQLSDKYGTDLGRFYGSGNLTVGTNNLVSNFQGRRIGLNSVNGPYTVTNFFIQGGGISFAESDVLQTPAFAFSQFETCPLTIAPQNANFTVSGGQGTFNVTTQSGCEWQARSESSWITTISSGFQSGSVSFTVSPNFGIARTGTISVGGKIFTINQATNCSYTLSPPSPRNVPAAANSLNITVFTTSTCTWTAANNTNWITVTGNSLGTGNGTVAISISANTGAARSTALTIAGQSYVINQAAATACTYALNPTSATFNASGGNGIVQVTSPSGCGWTATSNSLADSGIVTGNTSLFNLSSGTDLLDSIRTSSGNSSSIVNDNAVMTPAFTEGFENIAALPAGGWFMQNNSTPVGETNWFEGISTVFPAQVGTMNSYIAANYSNTSGANTISNWFLTPNITFNNGDQIKFWTRTVTASQHPDRLEVRLSTNGPSTNVGTGSTAVGDFTNLLQSINPNLVIGDYPDTWTEYTITISGLSGPTSGRVAFRYFVTDGGAGSNSNYIGIDSFSYTPVATGNWINITSSGSGSGIGSVQYTVVPNNTGAPRTGTMSIAGQTFTVNQSNAPNTTRKPFDFDGDGKADLSVFRPSSGYWYISNSSNNSLSIVQFGASGDLIAPADFDGDGKTDICMFRPSDGGWYRLNSSNNTFTPVQFGTNGDLPAPGDFDGDGKADITVYRPSAGSWYRINSSNNQFVAAQFGIAEDKPLVGDFDGDGKSDLTVFRPSTGTWYRINSATDTFSPAQFGAPGDLPVAADYDGDGKTDLAVYRPSVGDWYWINSSNSSFVGMHFGVTEDKPAPADFDGDGKADLVVFRPSSGTWYLLRTTAGFTGFQFGASGDIPGPSAFVR